MIIYDENGFDEDWNNKDTKTRFDTLGFNKNATIHKITKCSFDEYGFTRDDYKKNSFIHRLYNELLKMDNPYLLRFDGETFFSDLDLKIENIFQINLLSFIFEKNVSDTAPTKLNGTKDYRYKSNYKYSTNIDLKISFNNNIIKTYNLINKNLSKEDIEKDLIKSNILLIVLKNETAKNKYFDLINLKKKYINLLEKLKLLIDDNNLNLKLYEELKQFEINFNEIQKIKFLELESKIKSFKSNSEIIQNTLKNIELETQILYKILKDEVDKIYDNKSIDIIKMNELFNQLK